MTTTAASQTAVRRIAFLAPSGPSARTLFDPVFEALAERGHKALCLTPSPGEPVPVAAHQEAAFDAGTYDPAPPGISFLQPKRAAEQLAATLKDWRAQSLVLFGKDLSELSAQASTKATILNRIVVVTERLESGSDLARRAWTATFASSRAAVFVSPLELMAARSAKLLPSSMTTHVIAGAGVDLAAIKSLPLPVESTDLKVVLQSHADDATSIKLIADALAAAVKRAPNLNVEWHGPASRQEPPLPSRVTRIVTTPGAALPDLSTAQVYAMIPGKVVLPQTLLDAMASGRALIAPNVAGCSECIDDVVNGCLFEPHSAEAFARALAIFANSPSLAATAGRASRLKAERRFDRRDITQRWLDVLLG